MSTHEKKKAARRAIVARVAFWVTVALATTCLVCLILCAIVASGVSGGDQAAPHMGWVIGVGFICFFLSFLPGYVWNTLRTKPNGPF